MVSVRNLKAILGPALCIVALGACATAPAAEIENGAAARIANHVRILASDEFEGRLPGTRGELKTIDYISRQMAAVGLQPAGEKVDGRTSWVQTVPLLNIETGPVTASATGIGDLEQFKDIAVRGGISGPPVVEVKDAPLVFIGFGINAPDKNWDDYKGIDLRGKIALYLVNDPDRDTGGTDFDGKTVSKYGSSSHKWGEAMKRGAIGALVIHETEVFGYGWATIAAANRQTRQDIIRSQPPKATPLLEGVIAMEAAEKIFRSANLNFADAKKMALTRAFRPIELPVRLSARYEVNRVRTESKSVLGILPGQKYPDETFTFISHWDHQGLGPPDDRQDKVYNGAIDNATGVGTMLEIARQLAERPRHERSILFIAVTLEEPGILGSEYYALNPLYPLEKTVGVVALDGLMPWGRTRDITNHAPNDSTLNDLLIEAGQRQGRSFSPNLYPDAFLRMRTDHAPFVRRGVPGLFYYPGNDLVTGGPAAAEAIWNEYFSKRYHLQSDEFSPEWDFSGLAEDSMLLADLASRLANSRQWPEWKQGSEFKSIRDQSRHRRR